jgi:hypothetical protein
MGREIVARADVNKPQPTTLRDMAAPTPSAGAAGAAIPPAPTVDDYIGRLLKYVPTEIIGVYLLVQSLAASLADGTLKTIVIWGLYVLGIIATPFYLHQRQHVEKQLQLILSTGAFAVWVLGTGNGGPFSMMGFPPALGTIIMVVYTAGISFIEPQS